MMLKRKKNEKGFTLIELIIVIVLSILVCTPVTIKKMQMNVEKKLRKIVKGYSDVYSSRYNIRK